MACLKGINVETLNHRVSDRSSWTHIVEAHESVNTRDPADNATVLVIVRGFSGHEKTLRGAAGMCLEAVERRKSVRLDDPEILCVAGYSGG